jgi:hypothetical protein
MYLQHFSWQESGRSSGTYRNLCLANSKLGLIFEVSGGCHSPIAVFEKFIVASQG